MSETVALGADWGTLTPGGERARPRCHTWRRARAVIGGERREARSRRECFSYGTYGTYGTYGSSGPHGSYRTARDSIAP